MAQRDDFPNLIATAAMLNDHVTMFESTRRKVLRHIGWDDPFVTPGVATRSGGNFWCMVTSDCLRCNGYFTLLPRTSYLMWRNYMPVRCEHGNTITALVMSSGGKPPGQGGEMLMPTRVEFVKHPQGSVTSSGARSPLRSSPGTSTG